MRVPSFVEGRYTRISLRNGRIDLAREPNSNDPTERRLDRLEELGRRRRGGPTIASDEELVPNRPVVRIRRLVQEEPSGGAGRALGRTLWGRSRSRKTNETLLLALSCLNSS